MTSGRVVVCVCNDVSEDKIEDLLAQCTATVDDVCRRTGAASNCGDCLIDIEEIIGKATAGENGSLAVGLPGGI